MRAFGNRIALLLFVLLVFGLSACSRSIVIPETEQGGTIASPLPAEASPEATTAVEPPTEPPPSPTAESLAARVNETTVSLAEYEAELARYQTALGRETTEEEQTQVLNDLIDQALLAQGAVEASYTLDEAGLQARIDELSANLGGEAQLQAWMQANGYDDASFRQGLERAAAAAWMRDQIAAGVPLTTEQVHARQILLYNSDQASEILTQLNSGADFATLAAQTDPVTEGDLGWFPRGFLPEAALEEAAFALQPGEFSDIVETSAGFHILQVIERDPERPVEAQARLALEAQAVQAWLAERRSQSDIELLLP